MSPEPERDESSYVDTVLGTLYDLDEAGERFELGHLIAWCVHFSAIVDDEQSALDVLDAKDAELLDLYESVFDPDEDAVREKVMEAARFEGVPSILLVIRRVEIDAAHRGRGLGGAFVRRTAQAFGGDSALTFLFPHPILDADAPRPEPARLKRAARRLSQHWQREGFRALPGSEWLAYATHYERGGAPRLPDHERQ